MTRLLICAAVIVVVKVPLLLAGGTSLEHPPSDVVQATALKLVKEVYGDEYAAAKTAGQKRTLAKKLIEKAKETRNDLASRFVLLKLANATAVQAADGAIAFLAIDTMAESFDVDVPELKLGSMAAIAKKARMPAEHVALVELALSMLDQALGRERFEVATRYGKFASSESRAVHNLALTQRVRQRVVEVEGLAKAYEQMQQAASVLEQRPTDPNANLIVGKYYCFIKGDWEKGVPMLALGSDPSLQALAIAEVKGVTSPEDQVKLGDGWWDIAEKEQGTASRLLHNRSGYWYQQALPKLSGIVRDKVTKRVKAIPNDDTSTSPPLNLQSAPATAGEIILEARTAKINGTKIVYYKDSNSIGHWSEMNDWVSWEFRAVPGVAYQLEMSYSGHPVVSGSKCEITISSPNGSSNTTETIQPTGDWNMFKIVSLGERTFGTPGPHTLTVKPVVIPFGYTMNLKGFRLVPKNAAEGMKGRHD